MMQVRRASLVTQNKPSSTWAYANEAALGGGGWLPEEPTTWLEGWPFSSHPSLHGGQRGRGLSYYRRPEIYSVFPNGSSMVQGASRVGDSLEKTLMLGGIGGRRKRGRQRMKWLGDSMDSSLSELREMVMDREAWRAAIHGVTKCRT